MKSLKTLLLFYSFTSIVIGQQDLVSFNCSPQFDGETGRDIHNPTDIPEFIQYKIDSILFKNYNSFKPYVIFKIGRMYDKTLFEKRYNKNYIAPFIDVVYSLHIPNKGMDTNDFYTYCVLFSFDSIGNSINQINLPSKEWGNSELLSKNQALQKVSKLWQNDKWKVNANLAFDKNQSCLVWCMSRQIKKRSEDAMRGRVQSILINAHNGKLIRNKKYYPKGRFL